MLRNETAASPARARDALRGLRAFQEMDRGPAAPARPVRAQAGRAVLREFGGEGPAVAFVPSLINPPHILDLPGNSLLEWLAGQGLRPLLVDWGTPTAVDREVSVAGHVETLLLPLLDALDEPVTLVGYCLGGTIALAAAALRPVRALATIATPWRFGGFPERSRADLANLWAGAGPIADALGAMPMEVLQSAFWRLDPARTIDKFVRFAALDPASEQARAFVALEDWANDGAPLTFAAAREIMEDFFAADLPGRGAWRVGGKPIEPAGLRCPALEIVSTVDRIVPAASAAGVGERLSLAQGHVGMVIGARARHSLWQPLARWLSRAHLTG